MDGIFRYNQISMVENNNNKKTIFIMYWETFYYKVMLFGLKSMSNIETSNDKSVS